MPIRQSLPLFSGHRHTKKAARNVTVVTKACLSSAVGCRRKLVRLRNSESHDRRNRSPPCPHGRYGTDPCNRDRFP